MQIDLVSLKLKSDREITYIPVLSYGDSYMELPHVVVAGRNRYIQNLRHGNLPDDAILCRPGKAIDYSVVVPYEPWMETATLSLSEDECGCGFRPVSSRRDDLAVLDFTSKVFKPSYVFITPVAEPVKTREVRGSAYIDFPVNGMEIHPDYRRNPEELQKYATPSMYCAVIPTRASLLSPSKASHPPKVRMPTTSVWQRGVLRHLPTTCADFMRSIRPS